MGEVSYPMHGWLAPRTPVCPQRHDHGEDYVIPWRGVLQAPGAGHCLGNGSDHPFPNGFGPRFALIHISEGEWADTDWYLGHCTSLVASGEHFAFGHGLARSDQGHPSEIGVVCPHPPGNGGWVEQGQFFTSTGKCGFDSGGKHWYTDKLYSDLVIKVPDKIYKYGDQGPGVLQFTGWLRDCGWLTRRWWHFNRQVHGAVVAFKDHHHIQHTTVHDGGLVDPHTRLVMRRSAHWCRVHHHKETDGKLLLSSDNEYWGGPYEAIGAHYAARRPYDRSPEGMP